MKKKSNIESRLNLLTNRLDYLKRDILWDDKHGHSDIDMTADEKHISKLAGDMKYDKKHHSPLHVEGDWRKDLKKKQVGTNPDGTKYKIKEI